MSADGSSGAFVRPATYLEELCEFGHVNDTLGTAYVIKLRTIQPLRREQVKTALVHLRRQVPCLRLCFGDSGGTTWLREASNDRIDLEMLDHDGVDDVMSVLSRYRFNTQSGPLWCVKVLVGNPSSLAAEPEVVSRPDTGLGTPSPRSDDRGLPGHRSDTGMGGDGSIGCQPLMPGDVIAVHVDHPHRGIVLPAEEFEQAQAMHDIAYAPDPHAPEMHDIAYVPEHQVPEMHDIAYAPDPQAPEMHDIAYAPHPQGHEMYVAAYEPLMDAAGELLDPGIDEGVDYSSIPDESASGYDETSGYEGSGNGASSSNVRGASASSAGTTSEPTSCSLSLEGDVPVPEVRSNRRERRPSGMHNPEIRRPRLERQSHPPARTGMRSSGALQSAYGVSSTASASGQPPLQVDAVRASLELYARNRNRAGAAEAAAAVTRRPSSSAGTLVSEAGLGTDAPASSTAPPTAPFSMVPPPALHPVLESEQAQTAEAVSAEPPEESAEAAAASVEAEAAAAAAVVAAAAPREVSSSRSSFVGTSASISPFFTEPSSLSSSPHRGQSPPSFEVTQAMGGSFACVSNLVLAIHQGIADGFTVMRICGRLVKLLNDVLGEIEINDSFPLNENSDEEVNDIIGTRMTELQNDPAKIEEITLQYDERERWESSLAGIFGEPGLVRGRRPRHRNTHEVLSLDTFTTNRLLERCDSEGLDLISVFSAVANIALMDILSVRDIIKDSYNFYSSHGVNLRRYCSGDSNYLMGCLVADVHVGPVTPRHAADNFWDYARIFEADLKQVEEQNQALKELAVMSLNRPTPVDYENLLREPLPQMKDFYTYYLGDVTDLVTEGGPHVTVDEVASTMARHKLGYACTHVLHIFRGSLCVSLNYSSRYLTHELGKEYITNIYRRLNEVI